MPGGATEPERVMVDTYEDLARGTSRSVTLSDTGFLAPAPAVNKVAEVEAKQIWAVLAEEGGSYLLGTAPDGKLLRVSRKGEVSLATKFAETHIYALAKNSKGDVFVGTSPDGKIFKLSPKGPPSIYFDPKEKYIWAMTFDRQGNLFVATGVKGKIYKVTGPEEGEVYYDSDETHIRSLAWDLEGQLLAGSAENGLLYRISASQKGVVLASSGKQEINRIAVAPDGVIYFSATGAGKGAAARGTTGAGNMPNLGSLRVLFSAASGEGEEGPKPAAPPVPGPPAGVRPGPADQPSVLYRVDKSLYPQAIWGTKETILTLDYGKDQVYVGTGSEGYFYAVNSRGEATRLLQVEGDSISAVVPLGPNEFVLGTSGPARLFHVGGERQEAGVYESEVIDSGLFARWGAIQVVGKGVYDVRTRSGNTPKPDKSWYPWEPARGGQAQSPAARYLQMELQIKSGEVDRFEVVYLPKNLSPKMEAIEVLPSGLGYVTILPPPQPLQAKSAEQLLSAAKKSEQEAAFKPAPRFQPSEGRGLRTATWKASDPNNDDLRYVVFYRADGSKVWRQLARDLKETVVSWDSSGWPDGLYYLRVLASDATDNAPGEEQTDALESELFTVDNTPPKITVQAIKNGMAEFTVTEDASNLKSIAVSTDGKEFKPIRPIDGILDTRTEHFSVRVLAGTVLFIRAEDEAGNVSSASAEGP
jgi:hypothetical protein